jgi:hypothetical protein
MRQFLSGGMTEEFVGEISSSMVAEFPWLKLLPAHEILAFLREFAETMLVPPRSRDGSSLISS